MGSTTSKESLISQQIDRANLKQAAQEQIRILCLGEPLPPISSTLSYCDFIQLPQARHSKKWLQSLVAAAETAQGIVFTVPLTWYEQECDTQTTTNTNKLQHAMDYFALIRKHFYSLSIVVILTERPEFTARIRSGDVDMMDPFPNYPGAPEDPVAALHFVRNEFKRLFYESRASDDWATLYILYDDGCKRQRSTFLAQAVDAMRKTDSFAHMDGMLTPYGFVSAKKKSQSTVEKEPPREVPRTLRISSDESCSESNSRI